MKMTSLSKQFTSLFLGAALTLFVGCGGGESDGGTAVNSAEVSQLEAKVAQGDAAAAMKLGEIFATQTGNREAQMEAAKWFHLAGRLGDSTASLALNAVIGQMPLEDQNEVDLRVAAFKLPEK